MAGNLMTHTGRKFRQADKGLLASLHTPEGTRTWCPISHHWLVDNLEDQVRKRGWKVRKRDYRVTKDGNEFFGIMDLEDSNPVGGWPDSKIWDLSVGIRNTNNKRASAAILLGSRVWLCDNLSFGAEYQFTRKHHSGSYDALMNGMYNILANLDEYGCQFGDAISRMRKQEVVQEQVHDKVVQLARKGAITTRQIIPIIEEYETPSSINEEVYLHRGTLWALYNACTFVAHDSFGQNPETAANRSLILNDVFGVKV